jgi:hypothetical protein
VGFVYRIYAGRKRETERQSEWAKKKKKKKMTTRPRLDDRLHNGSIFLCIPSSPIKENKATM